MIRALGDVAVFENCADTDWTQQVNRVWIERELADWKQRPFPRTETIAEIDSVVASAVIAAREWAATSYADRRRLIAAVPRMSPTARSRRSSAFPRGRVGRL